jgi:hypothetical protein
MNALCGAYEIDDVRQLLEANPEEVKNFGPNEIYEIVNELAKDRPIFGINLQSP